MTIPMMHETFGGQMLDPVPDPYPIYARFRREQPVAPLDGPMGPNFYVTRYDDALAVLKNARRFSSRGNARGVGLVMGRTILEMEGREHVRHRNIIAPFFTGRSIREELPGVVRRIAHELIDGFAGDGRAELVHQFTFTFPMRVMTHIIGIPVEDYHEFHQWALDLLRIGDDPPRAFAAAQAIVDHLRPILERRRTDPTTDLLSRLVHGEVDGQRLTEDEILGFMRLLLPAGAETTYRLVGSTLFALLTHADAYDAVRADRNALEPVIEETLRWESPVQFCSREATEDAELSGIRIPAGQLISVALGSANRDERFFPDPDRFDFRRNAREHVAFGFGEHFCAGSHLARLEARIALDALLDRLPNLRLADEAGDARVVGLAFRSPNKLPVRFG
jgi:cytochrome P450